MRKLGWFVASCIVVVMSVALVEGQQDEKKKTGGFQFGGFGGFGQRRSDPLDLLRNASVKKELDVSDEQIEKLPGEIMNAIGKILTEKQMKRFRQIELQQQGNRAFKDESVQTSLKMTAEQKKNVGSIIDEAAKEIAEARGTGGLGGFKKGGTEKVDNINKETKEKIYGVLTADQRKAWRGMVGEEFKVEFPAFGGFGKDKKGFDLKKKTDAK